MKKFSRTLREDIMDTPYAKFYKLDQIVDMPESWCARPGDVDGVYGTTVMPYLKGNKNLAGLQASWQKRIAQITEVYEIEVQQEKQAANDKDAYVPRGFNPPNTRPEDRVQGNAEERQIEFKREGLPRLQWGMLLDSFQMGAESASANGMMSLIKANLGHPDAPNWLSDLQKLVKGEPLTPPVAPDAPAAPTN